ncbi:MAG: hypothetical protein ABR924_14005, partial [Terracidiphilus sp.]
SPGNLSWADYQEIAGNPSVELAVPIAVGDNYHGYRLVGTTLDYFQPREIPRLHASGGGTARVADGGVANSGNAR